jgi:hypothetical protein
MRGSWSQHGGNGGILGDVPLDVEKCEAGVDTMAAGFRAPKNEAHP